MVPINLRGLLVHMVRLVFNCKLVYFNCIFSCLNSLFLGHIYILLVYNRTQLYLFYINNTSSIQSFSLIYNSFSLKHFCIHTQKLNNFIIFLCLSFNPGSSGTCTKQHINCKTVYSLWIPGKRFVLLTQRLVSSLYYKMLIFTFKNKNKNLIFSNNKFKFVKLTLILYLEHCFCIIIAILNPSRKTK